MVLRLTVVTLTLVSRETRRSHKREREESALAQVLFNKPSKPKGPPPLVRVGRDAEEGRTRGVYGLSVSSLPASRLGAALAAKAPTHDAIDERNARDGLALASGARNAMCHPT